MIAEQTEDAQDRLFAAERAARRRAERLERVAAELARTRTETDVARVAVAAAGDALAAPLGTVVVERDGHLDVLATAGYGQGLAALCAQALERARLYEEARSTAARLDLVLRTAPFG